MALKDCETDNKSMPLLEWKFYSNLIKSTPVGFFLWGRGWMGEMFYHILQWEVEHLRQNGPQLQGQSRGIPKDSQMMCMEVPRAGSAHSSSQEPATPDSKSSLCCLTPG